MKIICFTGHRKDCQLSIEYIIKKLNQLINKINDDILFISGGAEGFDTISALSVIKLKEKYPNIKLEMAIPFKEYRNDLEFKKILYNADVINYIDEIKGYTNPIVPIGKYHMGKLFASNRYMVDKSDIIIAFWNNKQKGGTYETINYSKLKNKKLLFIK